jgi:hypothetical protein
MSTTRVHAKTDADGVVHLHVPLAQPNAEVELDIVVTHVEPIRADVPATACDRQFFATILGDRTYSRRRTSPESQTAAQ